MTIIRHPDWMYAARFEVESDQSAMYRLSKSILSIAVI